MNDKQRNTNDAAPSGGDAKAATKPAAKRGALTPEKQRERDDIQAELRRQNQVETQPAPREFFKQDRGRVHGDVE
jgi:hypothetical protein